MHYDTITFELADDVAVITLNRPDVMNALNTQMRGELHHAVLEAGRLSRVMVLTGAGRAFCAGQDLGDRANVADIDLERTLREEYEPLLRAIYDSPVPVISAVNGAAAGAGANIALSADVVIASERAVFMQAFARIGLIPDAGGSYWLPRNVGFARAMGAALFADRIPAVQAAQWGMIWEAVPEEEFEPRWRDRAAHLAKGPSEGFRLIRQALRAGLDADLDTQLDREARLQGAAGRTHDFREGVLAFLDKREPRFEGR